MMLVGRAAMLLWFDVLPETVAEHDEWHTHEHFPERVAIPGFRRASRWIATGEGPRYLVCYEVDDVSVLSSRAYLDRLNAPSAWTQRMMPSYRGMTRAFFETRHRVGDVLGATVVSVRLEPVPGREERASGWLIDTLIPRLVALRGVTGAAFMTSAHRPEMTAEQRIRGRDGTATWVLLVSLYDATVAPGLIADHLAFDDDPEGLFVEHHAGHYGLACISTADR